MRGSFTGGEISQKNPSLPFKILDVTSQFGDVGMVRIYAAGCELLQQGTPADDVYFIHDGTVKLVWTEPKGRETIVGLRWRGCFLGAPAVITSELCPTSAVTLTRSTLERIRGEKFRICLQHDADFAWEVHQIHSRELSEQLNWLGELACCPARSRLAKILRRLISSGEKLPQNGDALVRFPLKRKEIAQLIAVTPEHLSRLLHALSEDGHIRLRNGWIVIPNPQVLASL